MDMKDFERLYGLGVGSNSVRGRARIMYGPDKIYDLEAGDILVTPICNKNWLEAYLVISGLVTDIGGFGSHAAINCYQLDIPAVLGTRDATKKIKDGETIVIDGKEGVVSYGFR